MSDSIEYKVGNNGQIFTINREMNQKSKAIGRSISTLVPGCGHLYVDRSKIQNLIFTGLYCFFVYKSVFEYKNFISHRKEYKYWQSQYNNLVHTDLNETYSSYKIKTMNNYDMAKTSKNLFYSYLSGAILTNLAATFHLELRMNWDL